MRFYTHCTTMNGKILLRGYENGRRFKEKIENFTPYLFMSDPNGDYQTIHGQNVSRIDFKDIRSAKDYVWNAKEKGHTNNLFGMSQFEFLYIYEKYIKEGITYDSKLIRIFFLDLECTSINGIPQIQDPYDEITAITIFVDKIYITFGCEYYKEKSKDHIYVLCKDEADLLKKFLEFWTDDYPDILVGWNSQAFDSAYLVQRIKRVLGEAAAQSLSPWNKLVITKIVFNGKDIEIEEPLGVSQLDYLRLYKKFRLINRESYKLNFITHTELGEKKLDYEAYGNIHNLHEKNFELFIDYNIQDVRLVKKLDEKFGYIDLAISIAFMAGSNFEDSFGSVIPWDCFIHHKLMSKKTVIPFKSVSESSSDIVGGFVKQPQQGKHKWIITLDFNSLYPHLIMLCNIGPDTFYKNISKDSVEHNIERLINKTNVPFYDKYSLSGNFCLYRRDKQSFISELMEYVYAGRKQYKKEMIEAEKMFEETGEEKYKSIAIQKNSYQYALKIFLNSLYGVLSNKYFRYYDTDNAEAVTSTGQAAIQFMEKALNKKLNSICGNERLDYVCCIDTDSCHVVLDKIVESNFSELEARDSQKIVDFLENYVNENIQPLVNETCEEFAKMINAYEQKLVMKLEKICSSGLYTGKKKYVLDVWYEEGIKYKEPKIKVTGLEIVRSSTPEICRAELKKAYTLMLRSNEKEIQNLVSNFKRKFMEAPIDDIAFPRGMNNVEKWENFEQNLCRSGTPIQVRGAIFFNKALEKFNCKDKYKTLVSRDKIKFIYLREPNPIGTHVISYVDVIPPEFGLDKYIDKETQFEKVFISPLNIGLNVLGWSHQKRATLGKFVKSED